MPYVYDASILQATSGARQMKAIIQDRYGSPDTLEFREIATPAIGDDEVLIRTRAAGLHIGDAFAVRGSPFPVRLMTGLRRPKYGVPGFDVAGTVEAVGQTGTPLHAGGEGLIIGASGGVGSFAVQIAKVLGAEVTGVCSTANVEMVRSLGADHVVDYTREDFTTGGPNYDLILDNVENRPLSAVRRALTPRGTLVLNSGTGAGGVRMLARLVWPLLLSPVTSHRLRRVVSNPKRSDLEWLAER